MVAVVKSFNYQNTLTQYPNGLAKQAVAVASPNDTASTLPTKSDALSMQMQATLKRMEEAKQAIRQLNSSTQGIAQSMKAAAAARIQQIKEQLKVLVRMAGVGDPKAIARQLAQLSRELAAAAKDYAAAGGDSSAESSAAPEVATNAANNAASSASNPTQVGGDSSAPVAAPVDVSSEAVVSPAADTTEGSSGSLPTTSVPVDSSLQYADNQKQSLNNAIQNSIASLGEKGGASGADKEFVAELAKLAAQIRMLAKLMEARMHQAGDPSANEEISKIDQSLDEVAKAIEVIAAPSPEGTSSISVFV